MAAFSADAVDAAIKEMFPQLDDDTRDYVGSVMTSGDMSDIEELRATVAGFIVSFGVTEDDDEAAELVGRYFITTITTISTRRRRRHHHHHHYYH